MLNTANAADWAKLYKDYSKTREGLDNPKLTQSDKWFQMELPFLVQNQSHITQPQLSLLMKWKLTRGKGRPALQKFIDGLTEKEVKSASEKAFAALDEGNALKALDALVVLKGVGPATASAVLTAYSPQIPFMSDEALAAVNCSDKYTKASFKILLEASKSACEELNEESDQTWTPKMIEIVLWTKAQTNAPTKKRKAETQNAPVKKAKR